MQTVYVVICCYSKMADKTDQVGKHHFLLGYLSDSLFYRVPRYESIDHNSVCLADSMGSAKRLQAKHQNTQQIRHKHMSHLPLTGIC